MRDREHNYGDPSAFPVRQETSLPIKSLDSQSSTTTEQRKKKLYEKQYAWTDEQQFICKVFVRRPCDILPTWFDIRTPFV